MKLYYEYRDNGNSEVHTVRVDSGDYTMDGCGDTYNEAVDHVKAQLREAIEELVACQDHLVNREPFRGHKDARKSNRYYQQ